ncbi:MAG: NAD(P)H-dependent oxidoreductase subunit E [Gammaproteobacteria bacterium]|nr:MAG: NAD(P)H-dependent oxidoreductase subunit E [Gammaproteobacteria bacterium]
MINENSKGQIDKWIAKYPKGKQRSAVIAALRIMQEQNKGFLTVELMDAVADYLSMDKIAVYEVASFYSVFETKPVAPNTISICTNISCMLSGSDDIVKYVEKKLKTKIGSNTDDNRIFLKEEEECLAGCCGAPMMQVNHKYHTNLTRDKVDKILADLK